METITKYKACDGKEFTDSKECIDYKKLIDDVNIIMSQLKPKPNYDNCSFSNGNGFIQHENTKFVKVKNQILELCKKYIDHKWIQQAIDDDSVDLSYVGRLLSDHGIRPLNDAWYRLQCVDHKYREWGQPFYAINPSKGKQIELHQTFVKLDYEYRR